MFLVDEKSTNFVVERNCAAAKYRSTKHRHYINGNVASSRSGFRGFKRIFIKIVRANGWQEGWRGLN